MDEEKYIALYSRKSKFTGRGESVENQLELCRQYVALHYGKEAAEQALIFEDEGFSGKNLERPQFQKMMKLARKGKIRTIAVYRLDRISRNIGDFAGLIEELSAMQISFVSIREQFDTESPMGRAMMYIASVFSQLERETIAERIRDNMLELSKTGRWLGGTTPTGYISEKVMEDSKDGKQRISFRLKILEKEAESVKQIFEKFTETGSLKETQEWLRQNQILSKNANPYSRHTIKGILQNPVYAAADEDVLEYLKEQGAEIFPGKCGFDGSCGVMAYNRTLQKEGRSHKIRPIQEWVVSVGEHEGLVEGRKWVFVQQLLEKKYGKKTRANDKNAEEYPDAFLEGNLYCEYCQSVMRKKLVRGSRDGKRRFVYLCQGKEKSHGDQCQMKNADGNLIDARIFEFLDGLEENSSVFQKKLAEYRKRSGKKEPFYMEETEEVFQIMQSLQQLFLRAQISEKRMVIKTLVDYAVWDGEDLHLYLRGCKKEQPDRFQETV